MRPSKASGDAFMFFPEGSEAWPSQHAPDPSASLQSEPVPKRPSADLQFGPASIEFDALSLFPPEHPTALPGDKQVFTGEPEHEAPHVVALSKRAFSVETPAGSAATGDLSVLLRQAEIALEQSRGAANALRHDLRLLCDSVTQSAHRHMRSSKRNKRTRMNAEKNELWGRAEEAVSNLEQRAGEAAVRFAQIARAKTKHELELAQFQHQLQLVTEVARNKVEILANHQQRSPAVHGPQAPEATAPRAWKLNLSVQYLAAGFEVVAVLVLLGIIVMPSRTRMDPTRDQAHAAQREAPATGSVSEVRTATLDASTFAMLPSPIGPVPMMPTRVAVSDVRRAEPVILPAVIKAASDKVSPRKVSGTTESYPTASTGDAGQQFVGDLEVESVPTGAAVFVNQQQVGEAPLRVNRLRAGSHVIRIEHEGYQRWTAAVSVSADKKTLVSATLQTLEQ